VDKLLNPLTDEVREALARRRSDEEGPQGTEDYRSRQQRDRDRILYSAALHRLAYITQVTAPDSGHAFHNRLIHSLKVAQVGRRNAERLLQLAAAKHVTGAAAALVEAVDPDSVEASCLAHDLGHPPFGHIAEEALHEVAKPIVSDGFEGNAQSFRIVTRLAVRDEHAGLDLTRQTLTGLLKYPWRHWADDPRQSRKRERKWGYYRDDEEAFRFARAPRPIDESKDELPARDFGAELMDWADDLTYAVHDVDDFFRAGLVPLDRLGDANGSEPKRLAELLDDLRDADPDAFPSYSTEQLIEAAQRVIALYGPTAPYEHTTAARAAMRVFGSKLITRYLEAFTLADDPGSGKVKLQIEEEAALEVTALKLLVVVYVIRHPGLAVVQHGQRRLITQLFDWYFEASEPKGDRRVFPPGARERLDQGSGTPEARARVVVDLIAGLTETAAVELYRRLCDGSSISVLDGTALVG
jgi:dGTPase